MYVYIYMSVLSPQSRSGEKTQWEGFRSHLVVVTVFASPNSCWGVSIALDAYNMDGREMDNFDTVFFVHTL